MGADEASSGPAQEAALEARWHCVQLPKAAPKPGIGAWFDVISIIGHPEMRCGGAKMALEIPTRLHPTADGRTFRDLARGDLLDGVAIIDMRRVAYGQAFTYDILPDSDSGAYFAASVLIGSTLVPLAAQPLVSFLLPR